MLTARLPEHQTLDGRIAQLVEQLTLNQRVLGSSPSASTKVLAISGFMWRRGDVAIALVVERDAYRYFHVKAHWTFWIAGRARFAALFRARRDAR